MKLLTEVKRVMPKQRELQQRNGKCTQVSEILELKTTATELKNLLKVNKGSRKNKRSVSLEIIQSEDQEEKNYGEERRNLRESLEVLTMHSVGVTEGEERKKPDS